MTIMYIRKFFKLQHNIVRFRFFPRIARRLTGFNMVKCESTFGMIAAKIQHNTALNDVSYFSYYFRLLFVKSRLPIRNMSEMASHRSNKNEAIVLFSRLLIVAGLFNHVLMQKMTALRAYWA